MKLSVDVKRTGHALKRMAKALPNVSNFIAAEVSEEYAEFVRTGYLSGQRLAVRTGETRSSLKFFKTYKAGVFGVRPGVGIRGRLNYLARFERGGRAFMGPSYRAFRRGPLKTIADEAWRRVMRNYNA